MSEAAVSAVYALAEFNKILREEMDRPVKISVPVGPLDPKKLKIEVVRNYNTGKFEAVAFYMYGKNRRDRRLIKLGEVFEDYSEADKRARWIRRQVKHGQMIIEMPEV